MNKIQLEINNLPLLKMKFMNLGLLKTAHAIEDAMRVAGWEYADILQNGPHMEQGKKHAVQTHK